MSILSAPTASVVFPASTTEGQFTFVITGTNPDGSSYSSSITSVSSSTLAPNDLQAGAMISVVVSKNGISSLPSDPFTVVAPTILLTVPDATQKATISAS